MSFRYSPKIVTSSLILYLDAANPKSYVSGSTTWYDLSGNNYNGTLVNGTGFSDELNGCMVFDGTDDIITTNLNTLNSSCSFEIWANKTEHINLYNMMAGMFRPFLSFRSSSIQFANTINDITQSLISSGTTPTINKWYCFQFTNSYDGINTTVKIYINGVLVGNATYSGQIKSPTVNSFTIGNYRATPIDYPFKGKISVVKVYNKSLTLDEINQNYNATKGRYNL